MSELQRISVGAIWESILRRRHWIWIPAALFALASTAVALRLPKVYHSTAIILVQPQKFPEPLTRTFDLYKMEQRLRALSEIIYSRTLLKQVIEAESLYPEWVGVRTLDEIIEEMRKDIHIDVKANDVFSITYDGRDPVKVMRATNRMSRQFISLLREQVDVEPANPRVSFLEARLKELYAQLAELQTTYTSDYPELIRLKKKIAEAEETVTAERRAALATAPRREAAPPDAAIQTSEARVVDEAALPMKPFKPNRSLFAAVGSLLGLMVGIGLALFVEQADHTFRDGGDLQGFLGLPVLACVPEIVTPGDIRRSRVRRRLVWGLGLAFLGLVLIYFYQSPEGLNRLETVKTYFLEK